LGTQIIIEDMNEFEARACLLAIRGSLESAREHTLDMDRRRGWKALGYASLAACFEGELGFSFQHGYRLLAAYEVEANIAALSPLGENVNLKERWVRDSGLGSLKPQQQAEAYELARQLQRSGQAERLEKRHIVQAVRQVMERNKLFKCPYPIVSQMVVSGKLTVEAAQQFVEAVERLKPQQRGAVLQLMGKYGLTNAELVNPIGSLFGRSADNESLMLPEVLSGYLGGTPLAKATLSDWRVAAGEAKAQHMADKTDDEAPLAQPLIITIYKGDVPRTVKALKEALGSEVYNIRDWLMRE
jgi:hypothetical protein